MIEVIALLSLFASGIHISVTQEHFAEMPAHGWFMLVSAVLQAVSGFLVWSLRRPPVWGLVLTLLGNLAIASLAIVAYTVGIGGEREALNLAVVLCTAAELGVAGFVIAALRKEYAA